MDTNALISLETAVTNFLLKYKKGTDDYVVYLEHGANLLREFRTHDSQEARTEKIAVSALGIVEMPDDMISFKEISVAWNGQWWTMTNKPDMVNTTTFTGPVEGHDTAFGEGVSIPDNRTTGYGASGGVNNYYYMLDWNARRIFLDGIKSDTVLLKYVSSGISATGTTYIPDLLTETLDNYLLFKETYWISGLARERQIRQKDFENARLRVRNLLNSLTASQWRDVFWGSFRQAPSR
jgi:hypothetical protein